MKVYVVTYDPSYGGCPYVKGVFSTEQAATAFIAAHPNESPLSWDIEEFEVDGSSPAV